MQYTGERRADVSMFSFGTIKVATSFGGALLRVKNRAILEEMQRREKRYPAQTNVFFFKRLLKYGFFHGVTTPAVYGLFLHACKAVGGEELPLRLLALRYLLSSYLFALSIGSH